MNELKKTIQKLQADAKTVLFPEENINDKSLKKNENQIMKKKLNLLNYLIEM